MTDCKALYGPETPHRNLRHCRYLISILLLALAVGCSDGSGSGAGDPAQNETDSSTSIRGTAAAGAPIDGFVGAKDSNGTVVTADIEEDGSYELDLAELQPPVLLFASGLSGGTAYQVLSVAFNSDLGETVNVTPLTDLIVGNTARKNPVDFFNDPTGLENFTEETVAGEVTRLRNRLRGILDAVGVEEDFDLRNSPFIANRAGFDRVLDVVEVTANDQGGATLRNRLDGQSIRNDFQNPDAETEALQAGDDFDTRVAALDNIGTTFTALANLISLDPGQRPQDYQAQLEALLTDTLRIDGFNRDSLLALFTTEDPETLAELQEELVPDLRGWALISLDAENDEALANVGSALGGWQLALDTGSDTWRINGNQADYFIDAEPEFFFDQQGTEVSAELFIAIDPRDFGEEFGPNDYFVITGPGLPEDGIAFNRDSSDAEEFAVSIALTDALKEALATGADFDITRFTDDDGDTTIDGNGQLSGNETDTRQEAQTVLVRRGSPDTSSGTPGFDSLSGDEDNGELTLTWTLPAGYSADSIALDRQPGGRVFDRSLSDGDTALTITVAPPEDADALETEIITLFTSDPFGTRVAVSIASPFNWSDRVEGAVWDQFDWDDGSTWQ
ncbi:MAG: hypothetical protein R3296_02905 [Oleiphilaceae bacterium]|nr:hypothetical protein [Oleiphilaceae bacterium]